MAKQWCEECRLLKEDAYRRPDAGGKILCNQHHLMALRRNTPTGYVYRPYPFVTEDEVDDAR